MPGSAADGQAARPRSGRPLRAVSAVTFLVLAGVVVVSSLITSDVIRGQERLILRERTGEAAAVLGSAFSGTQASLRLLGTLAHSAQGRGAPFAQAARSVTTAPGQAWLVTAQQGPGTKVIAVAGAGPAVGTVLSGDQARLARRALSVTGMVTGLVRHGSARWLMFGLGRAAGPGTVVWEKAKLSPRTTVRLAESSPFGNLAIAIYAAARPSPATLVIATAGPSPMGGLRYPFRVGADTWLIVARSPHAIVGTLAEAMPWIILAIGLLIAMLVTAVVETLGRRRDYIATAKREISAATLIVSDLLDYSAGRSPILAPVQVSELVAEALSVAPPPKGVQVVQHGEADLTIDADHDQIRQALLNLITNGYDAMNGSGTLTIEAAPAPDSVRITVTDTGAGMDEETREAIFTPFFTKKARGIGLGLAVTKRIIEAHHGTITVQSAPSAGSSFTLTIPAAAALAGARS